MTAVDENIVDSDPLSHEWNFTLSAQAFGPCCSQNSAHKIPKYTLTS